MIGIIIFVIIGACVAAAAVVYNDIIAKRNLMREGWSGVDVQLKRRHDLIPSLLETVKGYMRYERNLLEEIVELRTKVLKTESVREKGALENEISDFISDIFAVVENYPDLKAHTGFLDFQKRLTEAEDELQMARRYYNGTVRNYNTAIESFPGNLVTGLFSFTRAEFFEIEYATERQVPDVRF
jgi:LemA protein